MTFPGRGEALDVLRTGHAELDAVLAAAGRAGLLDAHADGEEWSAVDLAGHIAGWERLAIELAEDVRADVPLRLHRALSGAGYVDRYNAEVVTANRRIAPHEVLEDAARTWRTLETAIAGLSDEEWAAPVPGSRWKGRPLGVVVGNLVGASDGPFAHVSAHAADLDRLRRAAGAA